MKKIIVLISGSGSNLEAILESCAAKKINGKVTNVYLIIQMLMGLLGHQDLMLHQKLLIIKNIHRELILKIH